MNQDHYMIHFLSYANNVFWFIKRKNPLLCTSTVKYDMQIEDTSLQYIIKLGPVKREAYTLYIS
jgi:hypothetical protein